MSSLLVIYKKRPDNLSTYDQDWRAGFSSVGARFTDKPADFADVTVILHSVTAQDVTVPAWVREAAQRRGERKLIFFPGNEYKLLERKNEDAVAMRVDAVATQMPLEAARKHYSMPLLAVPHALNADYYTPGGERAFDVGVRGHRYKHPGGQERNRICDPALWYGLRSDVREGFLPREKWRDALRSWAAMPSTEGGDEDSRCVTARHFDATGCGTALVMYPGYFNGILWPEHYIQLDRDHSNIEDVKAMLRDRAYCEAKAKRAREHLINAGHTYAQRARYVLDWATR